MKHSEMKLPKVGDRLMMIMTGANVGHTYSKEEPCIVIFVNKPKKYYTVEFVNTGIKESYKVPFVDEIKAFQEDYRKMFKKNAVGVYVYESGCIYPSIKECAKALGVKPNAISNHIHGNTSNVKGYHIYMLT